MNGANKGAGPATGGSTHDSKSGHAEATRVTIEPAATWYSAETYHQDYLRKNPGGYSCHFLRE